VKSKYNGRHTDPSNASNSSPAEFRLCNVNQP